MGYIYSVDYLANQFVGKNINELDGEKRVECKREIYNFKVAGYNIATAAAVTSLALSILTSSLLLLVFSVLVYQTRNAFMNSILTTGLDLTNSIGASRFQERIQFGHICSKEESATSKEIKNYLEIGKDWEMTYAKIFDATLLLNGVEFDESSSA